MTYAPFLAPSRSDRDRVGRGSGLYSIPGTNPVQGQLTHGPTPNLDHYTPFYVASSIVIDQLAAEVTTLVSSTNFRIGIAAADATWQPIGSALADSGNLSSATTGVKTYTPGTPLFLPPGRYLSIFNTDASGGAWRVYATTPQGAPIAASYANWVQYLTVSRTYAAFPSPLTAWTTATSTASNSLLHFSSMRLTAS